MALVASVAPPRAAIQAASKEQSAIAVGFTTIRGASHSNIEIARQILANQNLLFDAESCKKLATLVALGTEEEINKRVALLIAEMLKNDPTKLPKLFDIILKTTNCKPTSEAERDEMRKQMLRMYDIEEHTHFYTPAIQAARFGAAVTVLAQISLAYLGKNQTSTTLRTMGCASMVIGALMMRNPNKYVLRAIDKSASWLLHAEFWIPEKMLGQAATNFKNDLLGRNALVKAGAAIALGLPYYALYLGGKSAIFKCTHRFLPSSSQKAVAGVDSPKPPSIESQPTPKESDATKQSQTKTSSTTWWLSDYLKTGDREAERIINNLWLPYQNYVRSFCSKVTYGYANYAEMLQRIAQAWKTGTPAAK